MALDPVKFNLDIEHRRRQEPQVHFLIIWLTTLRLHLNEDYGDDFRGYDHELAQIEKRLVALLK